MRAVHRIRMSVCGRYQTCRCRCRHQDWITVIQF